MPDLDFGTLASIGGFVVSAIVWLVRLEGRVNSAEKATSALEEDVDEMDKSLRLDIVSIKARADADAQAHGETTLALVRVQEQLKYLTSLFERHFVEPPVPRPRRSGQ